MPVQDVIASCSNAMLSPGVLIILLIASFAFVVLSILYLEGWFAPRAPRTQTQQLATRRPSGRHHCENAAWRNLLSSKSNDEIQY